LQAPDLAAVLAVVPTKFQERWCGGPIARELAVGEQDASLIFDPFEAAGEAMAAAAKVNGPGVFVQEEPCHPPDFQIIPLAATAHQTRAALLVKLFANFYCFNAEVCPGKLLTINFFLLMVLFIVYSDRFVLISFSKLKQGFIYIMDSNTVPLLKICQFFNLNACLEVSKRQVHRMCFESFLTLFRLIY
jgi:hypothetical protein